jgi:hypothetical protein
MLVPQNTFIGLEDNIPGLQCERLPNPRQGGNLSKSIDLPLLPRTTLYIHNIQMLTSIAFESRFENFLRRMRQERMKNTKARNGAAAGMEGENVYIDERRIMVSANNTWRNITDDTYVSMGAPNQQGIS